MWLLNRLAPDHKTIADFRDDNGRAIKKVYARLVELCRRMGLLAKASVAIDGSKFKAVNNRDKNFTKAKVERRRTQLEQSVARYLAQLDTADRQEQSETIELKKTRLKEKLTKLKSEMAKLEAIEKQVLATPDQQISLTDPDSRSMATSGRFGCGRLQRANGRRHQEPPDCCALGKQCGLASLAACQHGQGREGGDRHRDAGGRSRPRLFRRRGDQECADVGITVTLPKPMTSSAKAEGRFGKEDFVYLAEENVYRCLAGEKLTYRFTNVENGQKLHRYFTNACRNCSLKSHCTTAPQRRITRLSGGVSGS
jgi:hypothetical protein